MCVRFVCVFYVPVTGCTLVIKLDKLKFSARFKTLIKLRRNMPVSLMRLFLFSNHDGIMRVYFVSLFHATFCSSPVPDSQGSMQVCNACINLCGKTSFGWDVDPQDIICFLTHALEGQNKSYRDTHSERRSVNSSNTQIEAQEIKLLDRYLSYLEKHTYFGD